MKTVGLKEELELLEELSEEQLIDKYLSFETVKKEINKKDSDEVFEKEKEIIRAMQKRIPQLYIELMWPGTKELLGKERFEEVSEIQAEVWSENILPKKFYLNKVKKAVDEQLKNKKHKVDWIYQIVEPELNV